MKRLLITITIIFISLSSFAQNVSKIYGTVVDESSQPVIQAGVQLLSVKDSSMVNGVVTDFDGKFIIMARPGDYILKFSFIGYKDKTINIHQTSSQNGLSLGTVSLQPETLMIEGAVVAAKVEPVTIKEDTVVYNPAAFRVAEDAMLEDLLRKIPGLEVDKNNNVTLHGREIKQLLVNGKKYFGGDVKSGLKNLSADMIENIKAYERESDFARITGVDDGEEEPVLDLTIKKSMMNTMRGNFNGGYGTQNRYAARANLNKITKKDQLTFIGNVRNTPNKTSISNTSRTQLGNGSTGNAVNSEAGVTFARDREKVDMAGHLHFSGQNRFANSEGRSQTINPTSVSFGNSNNSQHGMRDVVKGDLTVEAHPNNKWTLYIKPVFSYTWTDTYTHGLGRSFNDDPYLIDSNPNRTIRSWTVPPVTDEEFKHYFDNDPFEKIRVNNTDNRGQTVNGNWWTDLTFSATRRSQKKRGRSVSGRVYLHFQGVSIDQANDNETRYFRIKKKPDSLLVRKNYTDRDYFSSVWQFGFTWNEPIAKRWYLQVTYNPTYRKYNETKDYYVFDRNKSWTVPESTGRKAIVGSLPSDYGNYFDNLFSGNGEYTQWGHNLYVNMRYFYKKKVNMSLGVRLAPNISTTSYIDKDTGLPVQVRTSICNVAPNIMIRYNRTKNQRLSLTYRSNSSNPSLSNLLPITNGSNPLSITVGNPNLLPAFIHNVIFEYNSSNLKKQNSFVCNVMGRLTENMIASSSDYDAETGVRTITYKNIDGNWNVSGSMSYNQTLPDNHFSFNNHLSAEYQNNVNYLYNSKLKEDEVNTMKRLMVKERFEGCYRNDWLELLAFGGLEYTNETSVLRPDLTQNPYCISTGASFIITFPWKMRLESDYSILFQRQFSYEELNRNYQILNAELSQTILKGKGTLRLGWYDILNGQDNLTRSFGASSRSIYLYNGITSYVMLRFLYRFKIGNGGKN